MNKDEKAALVDEIAERLGDAEAIFAVDYRGISVPQAAELRARLAEADAAFSVVKNRLAKRAAEQAGAKGLDELFVGPTALTLIKGDPVLAAKAISGFGREHEILAYKGGIMDGAPLGPEGFAAIARLPALDVLHGQLVGVTASPLTGLARGLGSMLSGLAVALGQVAEQGLVGGDDEPTDEPEDAATEAGTDGEQTSEAEPADDEETSEAEPAADETADSETQATAEPAADGDGSDGDAEEE